jgi:two-component system response regulator NreC
MDKKPEQQKRVKRLRLVSALSKRQMVVARMLALGYNNKEVAAKLEISVKTVDAHRANLMSKLGFTSRVQLVRYAIDNKWLT